MPVTKRGSGFQAALSVQGRRIRKLFRSAAEAHAWLEESEAKVVLGLDPSARGSGVGGTLQEALDATITDVWQHRKAEECLVRNGNQVVEILGGSRPVSSVGAAEIRAVISTLQKTGKSNGTINRKLAALSKILKHAAEIGMMQSAPIVRKLPERQGRIRYLTPEEEAEFVAQLKHLGRPRMADLVVFLADTGCRVGEAVRLRWEDISEAWGRKVATIWESKGGSSRSIPLTKRVGQLLDALSLHDPGDGPFTAVNQDSFNREWALVRERLGKSGDHQLVPHALRHTCASRLVQRGVEILTVKELLGHKTLAMTLRYAHLAPKTLTGAIKALDEMHGT